MDKVDRDQLVSEYGDMTGVSPKVVRSDEVVAQIRQQRMQAAAAQQQSQMALNAAKSAKSLAGSDMEGDNALTRLVENSKTGQLVA
jgi:hypothetical protein